MSMLHPTSPKSGLTGYALTTRRQHFTTRTEGLPPEGRKSENGPLRAVGCVATALPGPLLTMLRGNEPDGCGAFSAFAALRAIHTDGDKASVGSRPTIREQEDAWRALQLPITAWPAQTAQAATEAAPVPVAR